MIRATAGIDHYQNAVKPIHDRGVNLFKTYGIVTIVNISLMELNNAQNGRCVEWGHEQDFASFVELNLKIKSMECLHPTVVDYIFSPVIASESVNNKWNVMKKLWFISHVWEYVWVTNPINLHDSVSLLSVKNSPPVVFCATFSCTGGAFTRTQHPLEKNLLFAGNCILYFIDLLYIQI